VLGTMMQSVGEVMAIGRTFTESFQKALRSLETGRAGLNLSSPQRLGFLTISPAMSASLVSTKFDQSRQDHDRVTYQTLPPDTIITHYDAFDSTRTTNDFSWNFGGNTTTNFYGTFYPHIGRLRGVRHALTPSATYQFSPAHNNGTRQQSVSLGLRNALDLAHAHHLGLRQLAVGRQLVDHPWQDLGKLREQVVMRQPGLLCQLLDPVLAERLMQLRGRDGVVLARTHPRIDGLLQAILPELIQQATQAADRALLGACSRCHLGREQGHQCHCDRRRQAATRFWAKRCADNFVEHSHRCTPRKRATVSGPNTLFIVSQMLGARHPHR
jgi:hypothetical protein